MTHRQLLEVALAAAERGWRVFPLVPDRKKPRRLASNWEQRATSDPDRIEAWWGRHPADNVGIATGPSGLVVVDLDVPEPGDPPPPLECQHATGGLDVLTWLAQRHGGALEATYTVRTASGGFHRYYQAPNGRQLRNTAGRAGWKIDSRARGGYVVAPGSLVDDRPYQVVDDTAPVVLPDWLTQLLTPPPPPPPSPTPPVAVNRGRYVEAAVADEVRRVLSAGPRRRNHALNKAAWQLARLVKHGLLDAAELEAVLMHAAQAAGYADGMREARAVIRHAINTRLHREAGASSA